MAVSCDVMWGVGKQAPGPLQEQPVSHLSSPEVSRYRKDQEWGRDIFLDWLWGEWVLVSIVSPGGTEGEGGRQEGRRKSGQR